LGHFKLLSAGNRQRQQQLNQKKPYFLLSILQKGIQKWYYLYVKIILFITNILFS